MKSTIKVTPKDLAKEFIAPYVKRGDNSDYLSNMGATTSIKGVWVTIGGYSCGKKYSNDFVVVSKYSGEKPGDKPLGVFKKHELIEELRGIKLEQVALL